MSRCTLVLCPLEASQSRDPGRDRHAEIVAGGVVMGADTGCLFSAYGEILVTVSSYML